LSGSFAWLHRSLPKKANRCGRFPRDEKLGGFQSLFPLYQTETHLCGSQKTSVAQIRTLETQQLKGKTAYEKVNNY
jgi:hypothetical protein